MPTVPTKRPPKKVGRPKSEYSQGLRLLRMSDLLHARSHVTISFLMQEFDVDRRTVQRDMRALEDVVPIQEDGRTPENEKRFRVATTKRVENLRVTMGEMIAMYMGRNVFAFTEGTELKESIDSLYNKVSARLAEKRDHVRNRLSKKFHCTVGSPRSYAGADSALEEVVEGILHDRCVAITYKRPKLKAYTDTINPYTLVLHNHALFVVAHSKYSNAMRTFAVERITQAEPTDETFTVPDDYEPEQFFSNAFGITVGEDTGDVVVRFDSKVAPYVRSRKWHPTMKLRDVDNDAVEVTLRVAMTEELLHWICGYGKSASVVSPPALAERVRERRG